MIDLKRLILPAALSAFAFVNADAGVVLENHFDSNPLNSTATGFKNLTGAGSKEWTYNSYGSKFLRVTESFSNGAHTATDAVVLTPALNLKAGHLYSVQFNAKGYNTHSGKSCAEFEPGFDYSLRVSYGFADLTDLDDVKTLYAEAGDFPSISIKFEGQWADNTAWFPYNATFVPSADGEYRIAFHAYSSGVDMDDLVITDLGNDATPANLSASDVIAVPTQGKSLTQTFNVTLPSLSATGKPLAAISKLELKAGDDLVATLTSGLTPGANVTISHTPAERGPYHYYLTVYNGAESSEAFDTGNIFVGPDTPSAPANVAFTRANGTNSVTWDAVATGVNNKDLDTDHLTYTVTPVINGQPGTPVTGLTETSYNIAFQPEGLQSVAYNVNAVYYEDIVGETGTSNCIDLGSCRLPFEESFAGAKSSYNWTITTSDKSTYSPKQWKVAASMEKSPNATPYDADGGLLTYNSFNASTGYWSQAITPPLDLSSATTPVVEFAFYHGGSGSAADRVILEISKDGADFIEIPGTEMKRSAYTGSAGWKTYKFSLADYKDAESVRLSFKAISGFGNDMAIDAIRIYGEKSYDLAVSAIEGDMSLMAGNEGAYTVEVSNEAFAAVAGADYTVVISRNGEELISLPGRDIAPGEKLAFDFSADAHAGHGERGFILSAAVDFDKDEDADNNESAALEVAVATFNAPNAHSIITEAKDNMLHLSWSHPAIEKYNPMDASLALDEEEDWILKEDYDLDNTIAAPAAFTDSEGNKWLNLDVDGKNLPKTYSFPAGVRGFMQTSKEMTGNSSHKDYSGGEKSAMLVAVAPLKADGAASDYLVSPVIPGNGKHILSFYAKSYSSATPADFAVEYSTSEEVGLADMADNFQPVADAVNIATGYQTGGKWNLYTYEIPAEARRVAIHFIGKGDEYAEMDDYSYNYTYYPVYNILCMDDIRLTSTPFDQPSYNVYCRSSVNASLRAADVAPTTAIKHNSEPIAGNEYDMELPTSAMDIHIAAIYPAGETALSAPVKFDPNNSQTGVNDMPVTSRLSIGGRTISGVRFSVYTPEGVCLCRDAAQYTVPAAGVYIISTDTASTRVIVR